MESFRWLLNHRASNLNSDAACACCMLKHERTMSKRRCGHVVCLSCTAELQPIVKTFASRFPNIEDALCELLDTFCATCIPQFWLSIQIPAPSAPMQADGTQLNCPLCDTQLLAPGRVTTQLQCSCEMHRDCFQLLTAVTDTCPEHGQPLSQMMTFDAVLGMQTPLISEAFSMQSTWYNTAVWPRFLDFLQKQMRPVVFQWINCRAIQSEQVLRSDIGSQKKHGTGTNAVPAWPGRGKVSIAAVEKYAKLYKNEISSSRELLRALLDACALAKMLVKVDLSGAFSEPKDIDAIAKVVGDDCGLFMLLDKHFPSHRWIMGWPKRYMEANAAVMSAVIDGDIFPRVLVDHDPDHSVDREFFAKCIRKFGLEARVAARVRALRMYSEDIAPELCKFATY